MTHLSHQLLFHLNFIYLFLPYILNLIFIQSARGEIFCNIFFKLLIRETIKFIVLLSFTLRFPCLIKIIHFYIRWCVDRRVWRQWRVRVRERWTKPWSSWTGRLGLWYTFVIINAPVYFYMDQRAKSHILDLWLLRWICLWGIPLKSESFLPRRILSPSIATLQLARYWAIISRLSIKLRSSYRYIVIK